MRITVVGVLCVSLVGLSFAGESWAAIKHPTHVEAQALGPALEILAREHGFQVLYRTEISSNVRVHELNGDLSTDEALHDLLAGTGLTYRYLGQRAITIVPVNAALQPGDPSSQQRAGESSSGAAGQDGVKGGGPLSAPFRLAQAASQGSSDNASLTTKAGAPTSTGPALLEEVVVTAEKREERLQDVPVPVTAISANELLAQNQLRVQDYYASVPGLNFTTDGVGDADVSIRGITTGAGNGNPTVGITVDDVPYGSSSGLAGGGPVPEIDPQDLARIEVLRGPQGTLYGASSIGGLIKYVTVDPSTEALTGDLQAGTLGVTNGPQLGYLFRGNINIPVSDTVAVRASGFARQDPGYIDDVLTRQRGVNRLSVDGGRASALWRPTHDFSVKVSALFQRNSTAGSSDVDVGTGTGDLTQSYLRGAGGYDKKIQAYSATVRARVAGIDFTSVTGYNINSSLDSMDFTSALGPYTQYGIPGSGFNGFGVAGTAIVNDARTRKFTQEVRLSSHLGPRLDWLLGAFYTYEDSHYDQQILAVDPTSGASVGSWLDATYPTTYGEYAAFADLTVHFTDRFDIQFGGRESQNRQTYSEIDRGLYEPVFYGLPSQVVNPEEDTKDDSFTYLVTPQLNLTSNLMVYARLASGYRPGGPNATCIVFQVPCSFDPDETRNYEIGLKGQAPEARLSFDASLYYIDWDNIQLSITNPINYAFYYTNASGAKSQGIELSMGAGPWNGMTIAGWVSWDDAVLTAPFPPGVSGVSDVGLSGDRLPNSSRFSGHLSAREEWPITSRTSGFVGAELSYVGDRAGFFTITPQRQDLPAYAQANIRGGVRYDSWTVDLFVNNVTDRRGVLGGGLGTLNPAAFDYINPRTVGMTVSKGL